MSRSSWPTLLKTTHLYMADTLASWITSLLTVCAEHRRTICFLPESPHPTFPFCKEAAVPTRVMRKLRLWVGHDSSETGPGM